MPKIHSSAIIYSGSKIAESAIIGPYCVIGNNVTIKENVELKSHVCIDGITEIGEGTIIFPFASIGFEPQDQKYDGEESQTIIGRNNKIREYVTIHSGTKNGTMKTIVGDNCLFMANSHVAHDCIVGNNVVLINSTALGGHVQVDDFTIIGGLSGIKQFTRIGAHVFIEGGSFIKKDIVPYGYVSGNRSYLRGVNKIGLQRRGFSKADIDILNKVFNILFIQENKVFNERVQDIENEYQKNKIVMKIIDFIKKSNGRSLCLPKDKENFNINCD